MIRALQKLATGVRAILGRDLEASELETFDKYLLLLGKWQRTQRLVGSTDPEWIVDNLFLDSLLFLRALPVDVASIADVGTGAGFPGIPIKIVWPGLEVTLIESRRRRASFLSEAIRVLDLRGARLMAIRAEDAPAEMLQSFGAVVARCAGDLGDLLDPLSRLVVPGGLVVCSGPPERRALPRGGEWLEVQGLGAGSSRLFAVFHV